LFSQKCVNSSPRSQFDGADSVIVLTVPSAPSEATVERVRAVLADLYGSAAELTVVAKGEDASAVVKVPYERA